VFATRLRPRPPCAPPFYQLTHTPTAAAAGCPARLCLASAAALSRRRMPPLLARSARRSHHTAGVPQLPYGRSVQHSGACSASSRS
jgi:hypothetical protein